MSLMNYRKQEVVGNKPALQGITFDFWDTLFYLGDQFPIFETKRVSRVMQSLKQVGWVIPEETIAHELQAIRQYTLDLQLQEGLDFTPEEQIRELLSRIGVPQTEAIYRAVEPAYMAMFLEEAPPLIDGAREALTALSPHLKIGLICNTGTSPGQVLRQLLKREKIDHFFKVLTFSNEVGVAKPNPKIFELTLTQLGLEPEVTVHIGDNPISDIRGAREAGMKTIWYSRSPQPPFPECTWRVKSLRELPDLLLPVI
ncbi:MAG: HAD family hydrolase [Syntrophomonadaceae bacterium]|nr:HAD family hydrolase [Syntrophomonadaceae bacterium]